MATTIRPKGPIITNPTADVVGGHHFVFCVATASATSITVTQVTSSTANNDTNYNSSSPVVYLHNAGDTIIIEKGKDDTITSSSAKVFAVGSPRS